jgi:hypothetical protein
MTPWFFMEVDVSWELSYIGKTLEYGIPRFIRYFDALSD